MNVNFDYFGRLEIPSITLCNINGEELGILNNAIDIDVSLNFNTLSEISLKVPKYNPYYNYINMLRLIKVEDLGQFIITQCPETNDGISKYKTIKAISLEKELVNKNTGQIKGTLKFYDVNPVTMPNTLLGKLILRLNGTWTIGHVDIELYDVYRTFDIIDLSLYNFLMADVEQTYGCVFKFDTFNRTINAYTPENAVIDTDIYLSFLNLVKTINIEPQEEQLCTALEVIGGGDLDIRQVNPLGTNFIYDFSFFITRGYMSVELAGKVAIWQAKVDSNREPYSNKLIELKALQVELLSLNTQLTEYKSDLAALKQQYQITVDTSADPAELRRLNRLINNKQAQIDSQIVKINNKQSQVTSKENELKAINQAVSFETNFTSDELRELSLYVKEQSFQEPNIIKTSEMTDEQIMNNALDLYESGRKVLTKLSKPRYTFSVDAVNFLSIPEFVQFSTQLQLGSRILLDVDNGFDIFSKIDYKVKEFFKTKLKDLFDISLKEMFYDKQTYIEPILLQIQFSYTDPNKLQLIFGDRLRLPNEELDFEELMGQTVNTTTNVNGNSVNWGDWINSGAQNNVNNFITEPLNTAKNELISSDNQQITMGAYGLQGKQVDPNTGQFLPTQVWLTSNQICFTDDGWDSVKTALGRIKLPNGSWGFGLASQYLIGNIIFGQQLAIQNDGGTITLDSYGFNTTTLDGTKNIRINPNEGIMIRKRNNTSQPWVNQMYFDSEGTLVTKGKVIASKLGDDTSYIQLSNYQMQMIDEGSKIMELTSFFNQPRLEYFNEVSKSTFRLENIPAGQHYETVTSPYLICGGDEITYKGKISVIANEINISDSLLIGDSTKRTLDINFARNKNDTDGNGLSPSITFGDRMDFTYNNYDKSKLGRVYWRRVSFGILGNIDVGGEKPAIVPTSHYGVRTLYCTEADKCYFTTDGNAQIVNGQCRINIDPIFLETIELNHNYPYIVTATPYGNALVWIDEIQDDYVVFKCDKDIQFSYCIKAIRITFGEVYLEEKDYYSKKDLEYIQELGVDRMNRGYNNKMKEMNKNA